MGRNNPFGKQFREDSPDNYSSSAVISSEGASSMRSAFGKLVLPKASKPINRTPVPEEELPINDVDHQKEKKVEIEEAAESSATSQTKSVSSETVEHPHDRIGGYENPSFVGLGGIGDVKLNGIKADSGIKFEDVKFTGESPAAGKEDEDSKKSAGKTAKVVGVGGIGEVSIEDFCANVSFGNIQI